MRIQLGFWRLTRAKPARAYDCVSVSSARSSATASGPGELWSYNTRALAGRRVLERRRGCRSQVSAGRIWSASPWIGCVWEAGARRSTWAGTDLTRRCEIGALRPVRIAAKDGAGGERLLPPIGIEIRRTGPRHEVRDASARMASRISMVVSRCRLARHHGQVTENRQSIPSGRRAYTVRALRSIRAKSHSGAVSTWERPRCPTRSTRKAVLRRAARRCSNRPGSIACARAAVGCRTTLS